MATLLQDLRYGARVLWKKPGFTVLAILTLALGIGANAAMFSVVNAVILRPFPYASPDRLVMVWETQQQLGLPYMFASPPNYADWREQNHSFEEMAAFTTRDFFLAQQQQQEEEPARVWGAQVSATLFPLLGVSPALGRAFSPEEDRGDGSGAQVVVISHGLWQKAFGGDPSLVGRNITLDNQSYTVVGVMPQGFKFPPGIALEGNAPTQQAELWTPLATDLKGSQRSAHYMTVIARLKEGATMESARADLDTIGRRLEQEYQSSNAGWSITLVPFDQQVLGRIRPVLLTLLIAVGFVLLIACVNIANLLLAQGAGRQKEMAVRAALGAGRWRLIRQLLTESFMLALMGGVAGLILATWGIDLLLSLAPGDIPRLEEVGIDARVMGFAFAVTLLTGVLFGLVPAFGASTPNLLRWLKESGQAAGHAPSQRFMQSALVVIEVALSMVLLVGAGLLARSFLRLQGVDPGFQADRAVSMRVTLPRVKYSERVQRAAAFAEMEKRLGTTPGIEAAGFALEAPLAGDQQGTELLIEGQTPPPPGQEQHTSFTFVTPGYFRAMGIPLLGGRAFSERDTPESTQVVIINEALARRYFPTEDPIGKRVFVGFNEEEARQIVGVVGAVRYNALSEEANPGVYTPYSQVPWSRTMTLMVRSAAAPSAVLATVREQLRAVERDAPIYDVKTMNEIVGESIARPRFSALVLGIFAGAALVLAAVGLYGVMAYSVTQRTREIGIRMALGAQARDVLRMVVGQGLKLIVTGLLIGVIGALLLTRLMKSLLFGVSAVDPVTFCAVSVLLTVVALLACYIPARRATRVDPMEALRYE
ncbi:MAG TPA: ABC transporter permease [Pyrinomonadaceae bacterium]|nr:ABC transporter permease [Pyrinomonadaceae bacterium]